MIQDLPADFYRQFQVIITGLDNVEARRWMNSTIHDLVKFDANGDPLPETQIRMVDGGSEGFAG
jgi:ubiquitin-activating enzyme E1 C